MRPVLHPLTKHPIPCFGPDDHGMEFKVGVGHNRRRRAKITGGVVHYTGSENPVETMFRVLNGRELGVETAITPMGSLFWFCDALEVDTADAGGANKKTWGVECISTGMIKPGKRLKRIPHMPPRERYKARIHGKWRNYVKLYPAQQQTLNALNAVMVDAIPTCGEDVCTMPGVINFKNFKGTIAHYNVKRTKTDVDPFTMTALDFHMTHRHLSGEEIDAAAARLGF